MIYDICRTMTVVISGYESVKMSEWKINKINIANTKSFESKVMANQKFRKIKIFLLVSKIN